jgi:hypothetical protein
MTQNTGNQALEGQMQDCIQDCLNCHAVCTDMASQALQGGKNATYVRTLLDCAEICLTAAHFMLRDSELHGYVCEACARVCTHCADLCFQMGDNDCGEACRACANSCQQIVKMLAPFASGQ